MHIDIIIPTFDRVELLRKTIASIKSGTYKDVSIFIVVDGNRKMIGEFIDLDVAVIYNPKRMDYVYSFNRAMTYAMGETVLNFSDDLKFYPGCMESAVGAMKRNFPDGDGAVALRQHQKKGGAAFCLMGRKFIDRFPNNAVYCPDYIHYYVDREFEHFTMKANLLYRCNEAIIEHWRGMDKTRELAREVKGHDKAVWTKRQEGLLWGEEFKRIE